MLLNGGPTWRLDGAFGFIFICFWIFFSGATFFRGGRLVELAAVFGGIDHAVPTAVFFLFTILTRGESAFFIADLGIGFATVITPAIPRRFSFRGALPRASEPIT